MMAITRHLKYLLVFVPVSIIGKIAGLDMIFVFISTCLSMIPLAWLIGLSTRRIASYAGAKAGGFLNATMSNLPELMIGLFAVNAGLNSRGLSSMAGSIISNMLLVLGLSILLGGVRQKYQKFDKNSARSNFTLLVFSMMSFVIPYTLMYTIHTHNGGYPEQRLSAVSLILAAVLLVVYVSGLVFSFVTHRSILSDRDATGDPCNTCNDRAGMSLIGAICLLCASAVCAAVESGLLVESVKSITTGSGLPEIFIGMIIIPILGNVPENVSAIMMAINDRIDISIEIAIGSSIQIALFVAPVLILASFFTGNPIIYVYDLFELVALVIAIGFSIYVFQDGKTNWLEGFALLGCYLILGVSLFFA